MWRNTGTWVRITSQRHLTRCWFDCRSRKYTIWRTTRHRSVLTGGCRNWINMGECITPTSIHRRRSSCFPGQPRGRRASSNKSMRKKWGHFRWSTRHITLISITEISMPIPSKGRPPGQTLGHNHNTNRIIRAIMRMMKLRFLTNWELMVITAKEWESKIMMVIIRKTWIIPNILKKMRETSIFLSIINNSV